ncbi:MAG: glycosyltransferase family 4 protein [Leptolyngbya sp. SIO4C5]|nr:glycosyltransferase family 4 protein [Leptolyngbya sp. SIO4C5]
MPSKTQVLLASGRPIIASVPGDGAAAKAVSRSGGGLIVQPENPTKLAKAILHLFKHPEKATKLGYQGRRHAETYYSFHQALQAYEELFEELSAVSASSVRTASKPLSDFRHGL